MTPRQLITQYLIDKASDPTIGLAAVRDGANTFLKMNMKALAEPTERKANKLHKTWLRKKWISQNALCNRCRANVSWEDASLDHIIALAQGGKDEPRNWAMVHKSCNSSKGDRDWLTDSRKTGRIGTIFTEDDDVSETVDAHAAVSD